jgi:hypothetical protein
MSKGGVDDDTVTDFEMARLERLSSFSKMARETFSPPFLLRFWHYSGADRCSPILSILHSLPIGLHMICSLGAELRRPVHE